MMGRKVLVPANKFLEVIMVFKVWLVGKGDWLRSGWNNRVRCFCSLCAVIKYLGGCVFRTKQVRVSQATLNKELLEVKIK